MRRSVLILSSLLFAACGTRSVPVEVQLLRQTCPAETSKDVLEQVSHLEFRISGEGIDPPITAFANKDAGTFEMPEIPLGEPGVPVTRIIEVIAHYLSADGPATAKGSAVVQLSGDETGVKTVPVFVRDIDKFGFTASASDPTSCTQMRRARAGHTATALKDGRVLIVGGAEYDTLGRQVHRSAEIFDPKSGEFTLLEGEAGPKFPRIFQTATRLRGKPGENLWDGKVLIAGGERDSDSGKEALVVAELFDPQQNAFTPIIADQPRTRHTATLTTSGYVLLLGGYEDPKPRSAGGHPMPAATSEYYDPALERFLPGPTLLEAKAEHCATSVSGGRTVVVAGGKTANAGGTDVVASAKVHFLQETTDGTGFKVLETTQQMSEARYGLACGALRSADAQNEKVLLAGGFTGIDDYASATPTVDVFSVSPMGVVPASQPLASARGYLCAVEVDAGTVVFTGGYNSGDLVAGGDAAERTESGADLSIKPTGGKLKAPRYLHQCTRLEDGSILITGGRWPEPAAGQTTQSLKSAELYTPIPLR